MAELIRIAQAQVNPTVGDLEANARMVVEAAGEARAKGAQLVSFPELVLCGYPPEDLLLKPDFVEATQRAMRSVARQIEGIVAVVGFAHRFRGRLFNAAGVVWNGRVVGVYHKMELPNYGVFDERRYFWPGTRCMALVIGGVRVLLSICEDVWVPGDRVERCARTFRPQVLLNISASPFHAGKLGLRRQILSRLAASCGAVVCYTNLVGGQDELVFDGGSLVVDPDGTMVGCARRFAEELMVCDLELPLWEGQLPRPLRVLELGGPPAPERVELPPTVAPQPGLLEEVWEALVLGVRDYVRKNGFSKVVLGISGGIDSALTAAIAVEALGADNVVGVTMPSQYTSTGTRTDAERLAANLGIRLITVPIGRIFKAYLEELAPAFGEGELGVEAENIQARIRGNILMALSNRFGWLVLTTGNKSETAVGYCTLYGDMAGGFAVIKDVPKTMVWALARFVNDRKGTEVIPESIITRPPTAELRPGQKDTDSLPPYEVLDEVLKRYVELDEPLEEIVAAGFDEALVREVARMVDLNEYKRRQAPPGIKITPKAFGKDRRLPITNRYRPWGGFK